MTLKPENVEVNFFLCWDTSIWDGHARFRSFFIYSLRFERHLLISLTSYLIFLCTYTFYSLIAVCFQRTFGEKQLRSCDWLAGRKARSDSFLRENFGIPHVIVYRLKFKLFRGFLLAVCDLICIVNVIKFNLDSRMSPMWTEFCIRARLRTFHGHLVVLVKQNWYHSVCMEYLI